MKHFFTLLTIVFFTNTVSSQDNNYGNIWNKVEAFEKKGLPKSALELVTQIAEKAEIDKNTIQQIKTMFFKSKYGLILEEDATLTIINSFKDKISKSEFPVKNVLESTLANLYWQYFQQNRYKFYNRTKTNAKVDVEDFRTWDLQTLFDEIHLHFKNSLQNALLAQQTDLSAFNELLHTVKGSKTYRPTLFDFLSHNALNFYKTNETSIAKPVYKFELDNPDLLAEAVQFSTLNISSKDTTSLQLNALKIYKALIRFHLKDKDPHTLVDVDIERLKFVNQNARFNDREALLLKTLQAQSDQFSLHEVSGLYDFEIANIFYQKGLIYDPKTNKEPRWKTKDAYTLCEQIITKFPKSKAAQNAKILQQQILQTFLQITSENHLEINKPSRLLIQYKNIDQLNFNVFNITQQQIKQLNEKYRKENQLAFIKNLKSIMHWHNALKNENDYQNHGSEIIVPELNNGTYLIFATPQANNDSTFAFATVQITNLAVVKKVDANQNILQVINRTNGQPIANAKLTLNYKMNNHSEQTDHKTTNSKGEIKIAAAKNQYWLLDIEVNHKKDKAYFNDYYLSPSYRTPKTDKAKFHSFLFTDRSIYRPAQTVFFKGIAMKTENKTSQVLTKEKIAVSLFDVNHQKIKTLQFVTNEFGSISGEFILPNSGLTGQYYINISGIKKHINATAYFSVEEYKRPKFEVKFKPVTETFKVNRTITIKGNALAYASSNITDAKVIYRVVRKVQYPIWYYWYYPLFNSVPQEIAHGETITNDKGEFEIIFKAIPDKSVDKNNLPIFNYEITANITDLNGETQSAISIVKVGYHALIANFSIKDKLDKTKKNHQLSIDTKNLNGEFVAAKGTVKIYKLKAPDKVLRPRSWQAPNYQVISKKAFNSKFPHEAYKDEDNSNIWEKGTLVFNKIFDTKTSKKLGLGNIKKWKSGLYHIILESKDKFGQAVKDEAKITLYSKTDKTLADNKLFSLNIDKDNYSTNDNVELTLASAAANLVVTLDVEKDRKIVNTYVIPLHNNKKTIRIPVNKEDFGGFMLHYSFAAFNSFQSGTQKIIVPYPKTDLEIETITFRDKLQPAEEETWSFKIKGPKGDKVSAELLASMYDASLDQFKPHTWNFTPIKHLTYYSYNRINAGRSFGTRNFRVYYQGYNYRLVSEQSYDRMNWFGLSLRNSQWVRQHYLRSIEIKNSTTYNSALKKGMVSGIVYDEGGLPLPDVNIIVKGTSRGTVTDFDGDFSILVGNGEELESDMSQKLSGNVLGIQINKNPTVSFNNIQIRKNLQETAFFYPNLKTDKGGNVSFSFTTPEALTQWKLQLLAHTKTLESATATLETLTQKELMVLPNVPRFLREGDQITISSKIANILDKALSGQAKLELTDALTGKIITQKLLVKNNATPLGEMSKTDIVEFSVDAKGNTQVSWHLSIPDNVQAVQYKIMAKAGNFSDGEQNVLPVLSNRMLVTETLPLWIRSNQTKTFTLEKLKNVSSTTLKHHNLTLEMTSNPAWYAVQALPYLMEYPYDCNEQTFSRYYANALASHIANSNPRIQNVFKQWASQDVLLSNLEKNQELKSLLIEETPWLRDAQSETEQKKRIGLLFNINKMNSELQSAMQKLKNNQMGNGAWAWFKGGHPNRFITQHILTGFGHLKQLHVTLGAVETSMFKKALNYLDTEFVKEYKNIKRHNKDIDLSKDHLSYMQLHYLYMRSFFKDIKPSAEVDKITAYYHSQIKDYWLKRSLYAKGLMALITQRMNDSKTATAILKSLKENSITSEELGMYWKTNTSSWYWHQAPIETQALLIEVFGEIENDTATIDNLKIWLLKNKQTNRWKTTKATTDAIYALLLQGSDWLSVTNMVEVVLGNEPINPEKLENVKVEAGTGYYKTSWRTTEIKPEMGKVTITKKGKGIAWGGLYWQYFEDLDKITSAETPLKLKKKLFLKTNTDLGEVLTEINDNTHLKIGNLLRVRIELRVDRTMEFVHLKDMRASGLEPINVLSQYKWQDGLGYYESTKDAATNFFFDVLPKGVYVFEYDLRVNNAGNFSNGISSIQSMYAPEFSSHSEGLRLSIN